MTPWTVALQAPLSMGFSRQEHWNELPFPSPGDLPEPETEATSLALAGGFFTTEPPEKPALVLEGNKEPPGNLMAALRLCGPGKMMAHLHLP